MVLAVAAEDQLLELVVMLKHLQPHLQRLHQLMLVVRVIRQMVEMDIVEDIHISLVAVVVPVGPERMVLLQQVHMRELLVV